MHITILNGNPPVANQDLELHLTTLREQLTTGSHSVKQVDLHKLDIRYCKGCFSCWTKTPGECISGDESHLVCKAAINCELLIFASPVSMGFISKELKTALDKLIPLIHPYLEVDQGEFHHRKRYSNYPVMGLVLTKSEDTDAEDMEIIETSFRRLAINFKSSLGFLHVSAQPVEKVIHEINSL